MLSDDGQHFFINKVFLIKVCICIVFLNIMLLQN